MRRVKGLTFRLSACVSLACAAARWLLCLRADYDERVLPSIVNEVTKAVVAKYNASELLTKREVRGKVR